MRLCAYRHCDQNLDELAQPPKASAKYCSDAHKTAEYRARRADDQDSALTPFPWRTLRHIDRRRPARRTAS